MFIRSSIDGHWGFSHCVAVVSPAALCWCAFLFICLGEMGTKLTWKHFPVRSSSTSLPTRKDRHTHTHTHTHTHKHRPMKSICRRKAFRWRAEALWGRPSSPVCLGSVFESLGLEKLYPTETVSPAPTLHEAYGAMSPWDIVFF